MDDPRPRRIMVVDDDRDWADALADLLHLEGHSVCKAYDGREAIEAAAGFLPEIVILDLRMPRMGGQDAARVFRRDPSATRPVLIAVSAFDEETDRQAAMQAGFAHFLTKPIQISTLNTLISGAPVIERDRQTTTSNRLILIADDNRDAADSLAAIVRDEGYRVHTAYDGREAIDAATRLRPDVVLLDIGMPKLTGYEAARLFRRHPESAQPVLIAVTGWTRESDKLRAQMAGFDYHLPKPVDPAALIRLLSEL